jgi:hypothetical protein
MLEAKFQPEEPKSLIKSGVNWVFATFPEFSRKFIHLTSVWWVPFWVPNPIHTSLVSTILKKSAKIHTFSLPTYIGGFQGPSSSHVGQTHWTWLFNTGLDTIFRSHVGQTHWTRFVWHGIGQNCPIPCRTGLSDIALDNCVRSRVGQAHRMGFFKWWWSQILGENFMTSFIKLRLKLVIVPNVNRPTKECCLEQLDFHVRIQLENKKIWFRTWRMVL